MIKKIIYFYQLLTRRISQNRLTTSAASLAYTTILALVPLITVFFLLLSLFPIFNDVTILLKNSLYQNLVPTASDTIENYLEQFIANTQQMTWFGIIGLIITSLLLIHSIDDALNHIWNTQRKRIFLYKIGVYLTILILGPILICLSIAISSYIFSLKWFINTHIDLTLLKILPFFISCIGFWLLYFIVPTEKVALKESSIGAIIAAMLFEVSKHLFSLYINSFPTYQLIYGVLASIPILFVWIYCSWCIVLFGAEFSASLAEYHSTKTLDPSKFIRNNKK